jgi:hypothetical protein
MEDVSRIVAFMENLTVKSLIDEWPTRRTLAEEVGVSADRVHKWAASNAIPASFHARVIELGIARGIPIDAELMVRLHAKPPLLPVVEERSGVA